MDELCCGVKALGSCSRGSTQANSRNKSCPANYSLETSNPVCFQDACTFLQYYISQFVCKKGVSRDGQCHFPQHFHVSLFNALASFETRFFLSRCHMSFTKKAACPGEIKDQLSSYLLTKTQPTNQKTPPIKLAQIYFGAIFCPQFVVHVGQSACGT